MPILEYIDPATLMAAKARGAGRGAFAMPAPFPVAPVVTVCEPTGTAYMKYTPSDDSLQTVVRPRVITQSLVYAPLVTHKIADTTTTLASANATDIASSKTLADEILADANTHIASEVYHVAAGTAWVAGHIEDDATNIDATAVMSNLATGYTLVDALCDALIAHVADDTYHFEVSTLTFPGTPTTEPLLRAKVNLLRLALIAHMDDDAAHSVADPINSALVTATTVGTDEASDQTLVNLLQGYQNSHLAVGDATAADLAAVVVAANAAKAGLLAHMADSAVAHGGTADATNLATLTAVAAASDQATANTLLTAEKATYNLHCAILEGGAYITAGPVGLPIVWPCLGALFIKTDTSDGVFTVAEFKSA